MRKPSDERLSYCGCSRGGLINFAVANRGTDRVRCEGRPRQANYGAPASMQRAT
jgi:hypothetical protein